MMNGAMHRQALNEVNDDIARLESEIRAIMAQIDELQTVARWHASKIGVEDSATVTAQPAILVPPTTSDGDKPFVKDVPVRVAAREVLLRNGKPMETKDITEAILEGGYPASNAENFRANVYSTMAKNTETFVRVGPGMWALVELEHQGQENESNESEDYLFGSKKVAVSEGRPDMARDK
jgi:hypothetical protein